jgi:hypothetical protein
MKEEVKGEGHGYKGLKKRRGPRARGAFIHFVCSEF